MSIIYTFVLVVLGWVLFDTNNLTDSLQYYKAMFYGDGNILDSFALFQLKNYGMIFIFCILGCGGLLGKILKKIQLSEIVSKVINYAMPLVQIAVMLVCTAYLVDASYNPFLYFRF